MENTQMQQPQSEPQTPPPIRPHPQFCDVDGHPHDCQCHVVRQLTIQADVRSENLRAQAVMGKVLAMLKKGDDIEPKDVKAIRDEIATSLSGTIAGDDDPCDLCGQSRLQSPRCERTFSQRHLYGIIRDNYRNEVVMLFNKVSQLVEEKKQLQLQLTQQPQKQVIQQPQIAAEGEVHMNKQIVESIEQIGFQWARAFFRGVSAAQNTMKPQKTQQEKPQPRQKAQKASGDAACVVPGCGKKKAAKGLCHTHWSKAHRLDMKMDKLSAADLKTLAADGRKLRWQTKQVKRAAAGMRRSK